MHWWDDIVTAILAGIAAFLANLAAAAVGWPKPKFPEIPTGTPPHQEETPPQPKSPQLRK